MSGAGSSRSAEVAVKPRDLAVRDLAYYPEEHGKGGYLGMSLPGWWRPFAADSPWNMPIGDKPAIHPN